MDASLALLFLVATLSDMGLTDCRTDGCFARADAQQDISLSYGDVIFQDKTIGNEVYVKYGLGRTYGPFQPAIGVSVTDDGAAWIGFGATYTKSFAGDRVYAQLSLLPGLYARGSGPDLGHVIEFRSGAEIGYRARNGMRFGVSYDHRSNADLSKPNPGMETLQFRVSVPLN